MLHPKTKMALTFTVPFPQEQVAFRRWGAKYPEGREGKSVKIPNSARPEDNRSLATKEGWGVFNGDDTHTQWNSCVTRTHFVIWESLVQRH